MWLIETHGALCREGDHDIPCRYDRFDTEVISRSVIGLLDVNTYRALFRDISRSRLTLFDKSLIYAYINCLCHESQL